jgi:putative transposase
MASYDTTLAAVMEQLIAEGPQAMTPVMTALMNLAMRLEREQYLGAGHYERSSGRRGYANGTKPKKIDTPAGTLTLDVPKTAGASKPFFPQSLERGRRSCSAVMLAAAEMYVKGVSTRAVEKVLAEFGIEGLSSTQVSRAAALLDGELEAWRNRPLGCTRYVFLDARYEKTREQGVADDCAVLTAIGIDPKGKRRVLGVSVAFSEAEVHWRAFLESLVARGLQGVEFITSDDHPGLKAARQAVRTSNPIERSIQQELKRRTRKIRVFPNEASLVRLVSAILVEIDEQWAASQKPYVNFNNNGAD